MLLGLLAVEFPNPVPQTTVVDTLWPGEDQKASKNNLGVVLHRLRARLPTDVEIRTEGNNYRLVAEPDQLDATLFRQLLQQAETLTSEPAEAITAAGVLDNALALWRGLPYQPFSEDADGFVVAAAVLAEEKRHAEELLVDALLDAGDVNRAVALAAGHADCEPFRERRWGQLMRALYRSGQQAEALRAAQRARSVLADAGLEPGPGLLQLETEILNQDPQLDPAGDAGLVDRPVPSEVARHRPSSVPSRVPLLATRPAAVPTMSGRFVGRADELSNLSDTINDHRWVSLVGAPGVGKSRLLNRCVLSEADRPVIWIDATEMGIEDIVGRLAEIVGLGPSDEPLPGIAEALNPTPVLLVFDNVAELPELPAVIQSLLLDNGLLHIAVTSRTPFDVANETVFPVGGFEVDEAAAFVASVVAGDNTVSDADRSSIQTLVDSVGTSPLVLQLLVGQLQVATIEEVLTDLTESLLPLGAPIEAALTWSINRLDSDTLELYRQMGVMAGWCSAADLAGIIGLSPSEARHRLKQLIDVGLVRSSQANAMSSTSTRYRQDLSMRTHARLLLAEAGRLETCEAAHAEYFATMAIDAGLTITGPDEPDAVDYLNRVSDDLQLAFDRLVESGRHHRAADLVLALDEYTFFRLEYSKLEWQDRLVTLATLSDHPGYARLLATAALSAWVRDQLGPATDLADQAIAIAEQQQEPIPIPSIRAKLNAAAAAQDLQASAHLMEQVIKLSNEGGNDREISDTAVNQVLGYTYLGATDEATVAAHRAIQTAQKSMNPTSLSWAKCGLGYSLLPVRPESAAASFSEAFRLAKTVQNRWIVAIACSGLATAARLSNRPEEAAGLLASLLDIWLALKKESFLARTLDETALTLADLGHNDSARTLLSWTSSFSADVLILPEDRRRLHRLRKDLTPPLLPDLVTPENVVTQARELLRTTGISESTIL